VSLNLTAENDAAGNSASISVDLYAGLSTDGFLSVISEVFGSDWEEATSLKAKVKVNDTSETASSRGSEESFYDRKPSVEFKPPTPDWGYLAQVNEKFRNVLTWDMERIAGRSAHRATFQCTPGKSRQFHCCMRALVAHRMFLIRVAANNLDSLTVCEYITLHVSSAWFALS
jgi:hypothetical protein